MDDLPSATRRFVEIARRAGLDPSVSEFPAGTRTAEDAAAAIGCDTSAIVKSLVFVAGDRPVVALIPGDRRLDIARLGAALGADEVRRASLDEVRSITGFAAGGTPPFGHADPLPVLADPGLQRHEVVWAAAGTPTTVFPIAPEDLVRAAGGRWCDLAEESGEPV
jgi:Cys-tRNA(Pro) deacylase